MQHDAIREVCPDHVGDLVARYRHVVVQSSPEGFLECVRVAMPLFRAPPVIGRSQLLHMRGSIPEEGVDHTAAVLLASHTFDLDA